MIKIKLIIQADIAKNGVPPDLLKTLISIEKPIGNIKDLLKEVYKQVAFVLDVKPSVLLIKTPDDFLLPPNLSI